MINIELNEATIRLGTAIGIFSIMSLWEIFAPRRKLTTGKGTRWFSNLSIILLNSLITRFMLPIFPVSAAIMVQGKGWGIFNIFGLQGVFEIVSGIIVLDLIIYFQHLIFHRVPVLWRLHMMHHADMDIDVTTGLRFHPIEIVLSVIIKIVVIILIGPSPIAVLYFEVILNGAAMFNHGNIRIPDNIDRIIRLFLVTPDMHRVHHSVIIRETNSNYGFNLPWWDRIFGTYNARPKRGHDNMTIGLSQYREPEKIKLFNLLVMPFTGNFGVVPKKK